MATGRDLEIIEQYDAALNKLEQRHIDRVNAALDASAKALERDLTRAYNAAKDQKDLLPRQRSLLVMEQIQQFRALLDPSQGTAIRRSLERLLNNAYQSGFSMGEDLLRAAGVPNVRAFSSVPLEAVAAQARDGMQRLRRHTQDFASRASAIVEQGLVQGWGSRRVQRLIRDQLGTTKSKAETIARTEVMSAQNTAAQQRYKRYGIEYEQVIVTPSDRLCGQCAARNMKIYKVGTVSVPSHPRCRCITAPVDPSFPRDMEFEQEYQDRVMRELRENGIKPDYGPSPFERMAGQTTAPKPASLNWDRLPKREAQQPKPSKSTGIPDSIDDLRMVKSLGGSTGAVLMEAPDGRRFVLKRGASPDHLREEFAADEAYRALGIKVPKGRLIETPDGPVKLTEFIDGVPLGSLSAKRRREANRQLQQHFAADALLGNWDVAGMNLDNILVSADGAVWRIDNGGALRFRAQGDVKGDRWGQYPTEIFSLRDSQVNDVTASIFQGIDHREIVRQINIMSRQRTSLLNALPSSLRPTVDARLTELERVARISQTLWDDRFNDTYVESFVRHSLMLRSRGAVDALPIRFDLAAENQLYDENGKLFDSLRESNGPLQQLADYMDSEGLDYELIERWMNDQAGSSWSFHAQSLKAFLAESRNSWDSHFWLHGRQEAEDALFGNREEHPNYDQSFIAYHVWNYELLSRVEMPGNDLERGTMRLLRTESEAVLTMNNVTRGENQTMLRGGAESSSAFTPVNAIAGDALTIQYVPHHRILGTYFQSRDPDAWDNAFLGDDENEIIFIPEGIPFEYVGKSSSDYAVTPNYSPPDP